MLYVVCVAGDDYVTADCAAHRYRGVDHIGSLGQSAGSTGRPGPRLMEFLHPASGEQPRQHWLRATPPRLRQHSGGDDRD